MSSADKIARFSASDEFMLLGFVLLLISAACFFGAFYFFKRKRVIEDTPTSKIRSAAQGYVEIMGHADIMEGPPIIGPLTGKYCAWYNFRIDERRGRGNKAQWTSVNKGRSEELFLIIDETGRCIIDPEGASITSSEKDVWYGATAYPARGPKSAGGILSSGAQYRYTEKRLALKETLYATGHFHTVGGAGDVFDSSTDVREILKQWKQDTKTLLARFDTNKDGEIDVEEWQAARDAALAEVLANHSERKTEVPLSMLVKTNDRRRPFLLSALSQDSLARRYQIYSVSLLILFFIFGSLLSWAIKLRLAGT